MFTNFNFRGQHTKNALPKSADLLQLRYKFPKEQLGHVFNKFTSSLHPVFIVNELKTFKDTFSFSTKKTLVKIILMA